MSLKEAVLQEIDHLNGVDLQQVARYLAFLRYQSRLQQALPDETTLAALYAEFAEEDSEMAEAGMDDYAASLALEDAA